MSYEELYLARDFDSRAEALAFYRKYRAQKGWKGYRIEHDSFLLGGGSYILIVKKLRGVRYNLGYH